MGTPGRNSADRSYLSIREVLDLLVVEFPDVTISKIRFLESQGLVNPERTPSGYRKFYEHDVERLRWVLRQQREHFLPLKVIKDRLDEDANGTTPDPVKAKSTAAAHTAGASKSGDSKSSGSDAPVTTAATREHTEQEPVLVGQGASSVRRVAEVESASPGPSSGLPGIETPTSATAVTSSPPVTTPPVERAHRANLAAPPHLPVEHSVANGSGNGVGMRETPPATDHGATGKPASRVSRSGSGASSAPGEPGAAAGPPSAFVAEETGAMGGASLSLDELTAASGLTAEFVGELQEFGLIRASVVGGIEYFDEEALIVASVAAKFAAFGIGARHLRLYRNAADREAGFIEQIVIPMVRQRNPEARARANQTADDLARLGQQLRGSLLRTALSDLLNG
jgi:DNA-binding transcriptional MerR regulator